MASEKDIRAFIEQQRKAGAFNSSGQFTLDLGRSRRRLGQVGPRSGQPPQTSTNAPPSHRGLRRPGCGNSPPVLSPEGPASWTFDLGVPGAWAVACADRLQTDASGLRLVQDEDLSRMLAELRLQTLEIARRTLERLNDYHPPAPPGWVERLRDWALHLNRDCGHCDCREEIEQRLREALSGSRTPGR